MYPKEVTKQPTIVAREWEPQEGLPKKEKAEQGNEVDSKGRSSVY